MPTFAALIALACVSPSIKDKPSCEARFKTCVEILAETPTMKRLGLSKDEVALMLVSSEKKKKFFCE